MNQFYDEKDINQQIAENQYYDIRDTISKVRNAQAPLKLDGIAAAIADEIDDVQELTKLVAELDWHINQKINRDAVVFGNATKKANEGVFVASRGIDDEVIKIAKILDKRLAEQGAIVKKQCQAMESFAEQIKRVLKV